MRTAIPLLAILLLACQSGKKPATSKEDFNLDSVKAHLTKMNESYSERFTTNDSMFFVNRYCVDASVYAPNMEAVKGREAIRQFFYADGKNTDAKIELPIGNVYGNETLVVEDGTYNFPDGKGGSVDKGKFIALWKKEDGIWKLYREIWNTDLPLSSK